MSNPASINEERLRQIGTRLGGLSPVRSVRPFPREKPDRLLVEFYPSRYPALISGIRLELRLRLSGEFNSSYVEEWEENQWQCRWYRHENPHNTRDHFHELPMIDSKTAVDAYFSMRFVDVVGTALEFVEDHHRTLWDGDLTYPAQDESSED